MFNPRVVCNVGVWLIWVNVLTMYPPLQFKEQLRAPVFGKPWKVNPLFYGLIVFIDVTSGLCLVMRTGPLIVHCAKNPLPSWDTIQKAPLWQDEEWDDLRIALARPVKETAVTTTDGEKSTTIWLNKAQDGTEATGARAEAIALVPGKAIPYTIALREYKAVCNP